MSFGDAAARRIYPATCSIAGQKLLPGTVRLVGGPIARGGSVISARRRGLRPHYPFPFPLPWRMQTKPSSSFSAKAVTECRFLSPLSSRSKRRAAIGPLAIPRTNALRESKTVRSCLSRGSQTSRTFEFSIAPPEDIARRRWKEKWPRYIRVHHAEFVAGTMANGISLNELMDTLGSDSFASTQRNATRGTGNTDPRRAYR